MSKHPFLHLSLLLLLTIKVKSSPFSPALIKLSSSILQLCKTVFEDYLSNTNYTSKITEKCKNSLNVSYLNSDINVRLYFFYKLLMFSSYEGNQIQYYKNCLERTNISLLGGDGLNLVTNLVVVKYHIKNMDNSLGRAKATYLYPDNLIKAYCLVDGCENDDYKNFILFVYENYPELINLVDLDQVQTINVSTFILNNDPEDYDPKVLKKPNFIPLYLLLLWLFVLVFFHFCSCRRKGRSLIEKIKNSFEN